MEKRGQITLFIIVGFLIVLSLSLAYYMLIIKEKQVIEQSKEIPPTQNVLPAKYLVEKCLSLIATQGVTLLGKRGGYIEHLYIDRLYGRLETRLTEKENLAYFYFHPDKNRLPKIVIPPVDYMESELKQYIKNELRYCLDDFEFFSHKGIEVKMEKMTVNVTISDKAVTANLYFPVTLTVDDKVTELKEFETTLPVRLGEIYKLAKEIVDATGIFEQSLRKEIKQKIQSCDQNPTITSKLDVDLIAKNYPKIKALKHESDSECKQEPAFCNAWTVKITVQYKTPPLFDCKTELHEVQQLAPLTTVYGILDEEAPQHPFTFLFMTRINLDEEGFCNYNC